VRGEWVQSPLDPDSRVAVFVHGGAFTLGSAAQSRELAARLSRASQTRVLSLDYGLAPEHPFPRARDEIVSAFNWLLAGGADPREVALVGESTGATIALAAALALRDAGGAGPGTVVLMSPVVDLRIVGHAPAADPMRAAESIAAGAAAYLAATSPDDPGASPGLAELDGLPSLFIQVGTADPFLDQVRAFAQRARDAGVDVTYREFDGMVHRWQSYPHIRDAGRAINQVGDYLLQRIGPGYVPVERPA